MAGLRPGASPPPVRIPILRSFWLLIVDHLLYQKLAKANGLKDTAPMGSIAGLRVVRSGIHGYGVVATRRFEIGEVIAEVDGVLWSGAEDRDDRYSLWLGDAWFYGMVDQTRW